MNTLTILARFACQEPPADWQLQLSQNLGVQTRRLSLWTQIGLFGARRCLADAGQGQAAPQDPVGSSNDQLIVFSQGASQTATLSAFQQMQAGLPMPITFLQAQPSQILSSLILALKWPGNALFMGGTDFRQILYCAASTLPVGARLLIGWVEAQDAGPYAMPMLRSDWWLLRAQDAHDTQSASKSGTLTVSDLLECKFDDHA